MSTSTKKIASDKLWNKFRKIWALVPNWGFKPWWAGFTIRNLSSWCLFHGSMIALLPLNYEKTIPWSFGIKRWDGRMHRIFLRTNDTAVHMNARHKNTTRKHLIYDAFSMTFSKNITDLQLWVPSPKIMTFYQFCHSPAQNIVTFKQIRHEHLNIMLEE